MRSYKLSVCLAAGFSLSLSGCFGPGNPVELPENAVDAAEICFAAQTLVWRAEKGEGEAPTLGEFSKIIHYPMVAAARTEPFTVETISSIIAGAEQAGKKISSMDYAGAIPTCEAKFGGGNTAPTLPEGNSDAFLSCLSMGAFMAGVAEEGGIAKTAEVASVNDLVANLQARLETDPELLVKMIQNDSGDVMEDALKLAFAQGNPALYLEKCEARFPKG